MRAFFLPVAFAAAVAAMAASDTIEGYGTVDIQWEIEVSAGHTEILTGTVEEVVSQAVAINPSFHEHVKRNIAGAKAESAARSVDENPSLEKREAFCGTWPKGRRYWLQEGVNYLRGVGGRPHMLPGPGNCGRVSCSWGSAIWLCNDQTREWHPDNWNMVADSAQHTLNVCPHDDWMSGQNFESGNWNTILRDAHC